MSALQLVEPDEEAYAALSGKFADYNAAHSTWDWKSYLLVLVTAECIVARGRDILNMAALHVRGSALTVRCNEGTGLTALASSGPA